MMEKYAVYNNNCNCHPETCGCNPYKVVNEDTKERIATFYSKKEAFKLADLLNGKSS